MTCNEFHLHLSGSRANELPPEASVHIEQCTPCRHAAAEQAMLAADLRLLRDAAPVVSPSLDEAIISTYRSLRSSVFSELSASSSSQVRRPGKRLALISALATVAAGVLIAILLAAPSPVDHLETWNAPQPPAPQIAHTAIARPRDAHAAIVRKSHPERINPPAAVAHNRPQPVIPAPATVSGFQSLMYCDPLNCPGPMDVVRIQIPASTFNRLPASRTANGYVQADVVVGSDGFARAIRIVH